MEPGINMSHAEVYRLTGTLPANRIEEIIEEADAVALLLSGRPHIGEAMGGYPAEDWADGVLSDLAEIIKKARGDNRTRLEALHETLSNLSSETARAAEQGIEELRKLDALFEQAGG